MRWSVFRQPEVPKASVLQQADKADVQVEQHDEPEDAVEMPSFRLFTLDAPSCRSCRRYDLVLEAVNYLLV